jgi:Fis family transcriptional regulator
MLHQFEKPLISVVLEYTRGNQTRTAEILGLNRGTLRKKLKAHQLL